MTLALVSATLAVRGQEVARPAPGAIVGIKVFQDGAVEEEAGRIAAALEGRPAAVRLEFEMPETAPLGRGILEEAAGTARTHWEKGGIRYTQSVLLGEMKVAVNGLRDVDFDEEYRRIKTGRGTAGQQSASEPGIALVD